MSSFVQERERDRPPHHFIPRSSPQPDLLRNILPSVDSTASFSEHAGDVDPHGDTTVDSPQRDSDNDGEDSAFAGDDNTFSPDKMPQYTSRDVGDPTQIRKNKQSMADLKLRRLTELNNRLREDLERERIPVSQASKR